MALTSERSAMLLALADGRLWADVGEDIGKWIASVETLHGREADGFWAAVVKAVTTQRAATRAISRYASQAMVGYVEAANELTAALKAKPDQAQALFRSLAKG